MKRILWLSILAAAGFASRQTVAATAMPGSNQTEYNWKLTQASESAQLLTLMCTGCSSSGSDVPLVSVLRDQLAGTNADGVPNDRLTDVWLLTYSPTTV